jgi:hypothetical protein
MDSRGGHVFHRQSSSGGGSDASHHLATSEVVQSLNDHRLVWPDYSGNTMFQTLGNIAVNRKARVCCSLIFGRGHTAAAHRKGRIAGTCNASPSSPEPGRLCGIRRRRGGRDQWSALARSAVNRYSYRKSRLRNTSSPLSKGAAPEAQGLSGDAGKAWEVVTSGRNSEAKTSLVR